MGVLHANDVDVLVLNEAPPVLAARVLREGVGAYCRDEEALRAFALGRLLRAEDLEPFLRRHEKTLLQMVIDVAGELSGSAGLAFADYPEAVENLRELGFPEPLVEQRARLPGFRNVVVHGYLRVDEERVLRALDELKPVEEFLASAAGRLGEQT